MVQPYACAEARDDLPDKRRPAPTIGTRWPWAALLLMLCSMQGCGGCGCSRSGMPTPEQLRLSDQAAQKEAEAERAEQQRSKTRREERQRKAEDQRKAAELQQQRSEEAKLARAKAEEEKKRVQAAPEVPDDFAEWQPDHYRQVWQFGDSRVAAALSYLVQHSAHTEKEVQLLRDLLEAKPAQGQTNLAHPAAARRVVDPTIIAARIRGAVAALKANGTEAARAALGDIVRGRLKTEQDTVAVEAALAFFIVDESPQSQEFLLQVLTAPGEPRPGEGNIRSEALQQKALALVRPTAGRLLRMKIAQRVVDPATPSRTRDLLMPLLKEVRPENIDAQIVLCQSDSLDAPTRTAVAKTLTGYSADALASTLGIPEKVRAAANPDGPFLAAERLWGEKFIEFLENRQQAADSLAQVSPLLLLAATIPTDAARARLRRTLERHWAEGPAALKSAGNVLCDPGLTVMLKSILPRTSSAASGMKRATTPKLTKMQEALKKVHQQKDITDEAWRKFVADLVRFQCRQFRAVSLQPAEGARTEGRPLEDIEAWPGQPSRSYFDTPPTAIYRLDWPGAAKEKLSGVSLDPMQISYVRFEKKARPSHVEAHFRRWLKGCQERPWNDGTWLDSLSIGSAPGRSRSIDVFITGAKSGPLRASQEEQELTIEILSVEVKSLAEIARVAGGT